MHNMTPATVYLVGAGPGDPELLTLKAHRLLGQADVIVYDRLVSSDVLDIVPSGTSRIFVGKAANRHTMVQAEINKLLVKLAHAGRTVVRLKGGDPFVFGRGSEEADVLVQNGIPFEVVPGITAASGCTAALGIPLTHRGLATGVRFVTGHCRGDSPLDLNWASLADPDTTLVVYMGLAHLEQISRQLVKHGLSADTPAVAIANGTTDRQRVCRAGLGDISAAVEAMDLNPPVLTVIGGTAGLADRWLETWSRVPLELAGASVANDG